MTKRIERIKVGRITGIVSAERMAERMKEFEDLAKTQGYELSYMVDIIPVYSREETEEEYQARLTRWGQSNDFNF